MAKYKHLSMDERTRIQQMLGQTASAAHSEYLTIQTESWILGKHDENP